MTLPARLWSPVLFVGVTFGLLFGIADEVVASGACEQEIEFLGAFGAHQGTTLVVLERVLGECLYSNLVLMNVVGDRVSTTTLVLSHDVADVSEVLREWGVTRVDPWSKREGSPLASGLSAPAVNSNLTRKYFDLQCHPCAERWNSLHGIDGVVPPEASGRGVEVIYAWPRGLYLDYEVGDIHAVDDHGLVLITTSAPGAVESGDSQDGFLLVRALE
jgi:hypothetical protein